MTPDLQNALSHHEYIRERLKAEFPDADDETIADTLLGETTLDVVICNLMRQAFEAETMATALGIRIEEWQKRKSRFEHKNKTIRDIVLRVLERADLPTIVTDDMTLGRAKVPRGLVISDEKAIPKEYYNPPDDPTLDKRKIIQALKDGTVIAGASLDNGGVRLNARRS